MISFEKAFDSQFIVKIVIVFVIIVFFLKSIVKIEK